MLIIGLTGGIGSGKSRVATCLAGMLSCPLVNVDRICRQMLEPGEMGYRSLVRRYGDRFLAADGRVNRSLLRESLFGEPAFRAELDALLHPLARHCLAATLERMHSRRVLVEIPLLFEAGWEDVVGVVVAVWAPESVRCRRIITRDQVEPGQAARAIRAQDDLGEKVLRSDHVIDNGGPWQVTRLQVRHLARILMENSLPGRKKCLTRREEVNI